MPSVRKEVSPFRQMTSMQAVSRVKHSVNLGSVKETMGISNAITISEEAIETTPGNMTYQNRTPSVQVPESVFQELGQAFDQSYAVFWRDTHFQSSDQNQSKAYRGLSNCCSESQWHFYEWKPVNTNHSHISSKWGGLIFRAPRRRGRGGVHCEHASSYAPQTWSPACEPADSPPLWSLEKTSIQCTKCVITHSMIGYHHRNNLNWYGEHYRRFHIVVLENGEKQSEEAWLLITLESSLASNWHNFALIWWKLLMGKACLWPFYVLEEQLCVFFCLSVCE